MTVLCRGQGLEPHVEVERNLVEFGPILPHSPGDEQTILMRNPCPFPVEIYNLECDKLYLEEEKVKERSHITKFSPSPIFGPLLFSIELMVTGRISGRMGSSPFIDGITGRYFLSKKSG